MLHSSAFLLPAAAPQQPDRTYALVVLNQRLPSFAPLLWSRAQLRVCADGGANRVYDEMPALHPGDDPHAVRLRYMPDVIKGDMDSIREDVKTFYSGLNVTIIDQSEDQDTTDLHKCISFITNRSPVSEISNLCILVVGALGGRFDHEIGNINVLCLFEHLRIILISEDCFILLLPKTHVHEIHVEPTVEGPHCGLIPIATPARTTTTGLQWNLSDDMEMRFGGLISTSNKVAEKVITVSSDSNLLWTIEIIKNRISAEQ